jgi:hypothetical protein
MAQTTYVLRYWDREQRGHVVLRFTDATRAEAIRQGRLRLRALYTPRYEPRRFDLVSMVPDPR